jgi:hypothetical protein
MAADVSATDDEGRKLPFRKVGLIAVVGNEDAAHKRSPVGHRLPGPPHMESTPKTTLPSQPTRRLNGHSRQPHLRAPPTSPTGPPPHLHAHGRDDEAHDT